MAKKLKNIFKIIIFFSVGILIFWWVSKDQDFNALKKALSQANYTWIFVALVLGIFSHISRAARWNLLIKPMGYNPKLINSFFSVMIMYLSNMAIPRSGEVVRCGVMSKTEDIPFTKLLGTVFIERVIDFAMLFIFLAIVLFSQLDEILKLITNNPDIKDKLNNLTSSTTSLIFIALFFILIFALIYIFRNKIIQTKLFQKIKGIIFQFSDGIKSILKMEKKFEFIAHSIFIWLMYFLMIYVVFWSFDFTENLSLITGLTVFVMSAFGMVAPSPGGMGTWHFMVIETLYVYGVDKSDAYAFAIASHESMTIMMIVVGVASVILLPIFNKNKK
ncbi:MAG: flippase-like domain-containing protein [Chlorobi bacterium]|nr:flippase-like domain-containing protein [Chlorobiota bacterium]